MTKTARLVLQDAEVAASELPDPPDEFWRVRWVAVVALLRIIGHVLQKVDGPAGDAAYQEASKAAWATLATKRSAVFHEFIEDGRNLLLKQYGFQAQQHTTITLTGLPLMVGDVHAGTVFHPPAVASHSWTVMGDGAFQGQKPADVVRQAIAFWRKYLDDLDNTAAEIRRRSAAS
jgi:hypothetical protein